MISIPAARKMASGVRISQKKTHKKKHTVQPEFRDETLFHGHEKDKQVGNKKRTSDLNSLSPSTYRTNYAATAKPTHGKGGRVLQPGGGFAGN
jgi:hypothetical protein